MLTKEPRSDCFRPQIARLMVAAVAIGAVVASGAARAQCVSTAAQFQQALTDASDGGVNAGQDVEIDLVQGTYKTGVATSNGPFTYHSTAATGQIIISGGWGAGCGVFLRDASLTVLDGNNANQVLRIQNATANVFMEFVTIQNGESTTAGGGLAINSGILGGDVYVYDNIIQNNHTTASGGGFSIQGAGSQVAAVGNLVVGNAADSDYGAGVEYSVGGSQAFVTFNTIYNNTTTASGGTGGLYCCGTPSNAPTFRANIFWQNTNYGLDLEGTKADVEFNDYGTITGVTPQAANNLSVAPKFVDAANGNYRLAATSPLLADCPASICSSLRSDLAGNYYPSGGLLDIGAYEDTIFVGGFEGD
jgi:hypothetical protein